MSKDKTGWNKYRRGPVRQRTTEFTVTIESLGNNGDGIGRHEGKTVFVPYTLPGERVLVKPIVVKKSWLRGQVVQTLESVPERQTPACRFFGECGGCTWQHVPYSRQLQYKAEHLDDALRRIGKLPSPDITGIVASESPYYYRNRIQGHIREGHFHFKRRASEELVAIDQCPIAEAAINQRLAEGFAQQPDGRVEIAEFDGQVTVESLDNEHTTDTGFRQVNSAVNAALSRQVMSIAERFDGNHYLDLYCGRGNWSLELAQRDPRSRIIGVDASATNINFARTAALATNLPNVRFQHGRVEKLLGSLRLSDTFCIVDPPRAGLDESVCQALCSNPPLHIVYISCHPASLARDLALLTRHCFRLEAVTPFDMFPQTAHLESVSVLSCIKGT